MTNSKLNKEDRTISQSTMKSVMKYAPKDGFKLTDEMLNKAYRVISVDEYDVNNIKSFSVTLQDEDGHVITVAAGALKRSRTLPKGTEITGKAYGETKNVFKRSDADDMWSGSSYSHTGLKMVKDDEFIIPEKMFLCAAILTEDANTGDPLLNPFLYKEYRKVVKEYDKTDNYPSMDDFREELRKSKDDGRLPFLPKAMQEPEKFAWVKEDISDFKHTLIFRALK